MRIIVATDLGTGSDSAVALATAMARRFGDTLVLVHAFEWHAGAYGMSFETMPEVVDRLRGFTETQLRNAAVGIRNTGLQVEERLLEGPVAEGIVQMGNEPNVRLIVVGTHAPSAPARLVLGSVSERVAMLSQRPVLIAKAGANLDHPGAWSGQRPLRVGVGIDNSRATRVAVAWVRDLMRTIPCEITPMHAFSPPDEAARLGIWRPAPQGYEAVIEMLTRKLAPVVEGLVASPLDLRLLPTFGSVPERIVMEAEQVKADVVVLGNHQRRALRRLRLGSMSHPILRSASMPVIVIPTTGDVEEETLPEIHSVLLATDFSDCARPAVRHAYGLVRPTRGVVHLCNVFETPPSSLSPVLGSDSALHLTSERRQEVEAALAALVPRQATEAGIITRFHAVESSQVAEALCQVARRLEVDAICLGSHGRRGLTARILGSVAQQVTSHAEQPVYVVRGAEE